MAQPKTKLTTYWQVCHLTHPVKQHCKYGIVHPRPQQHKQVDIQSQDGQPYVGTLNNGFTDSKIGAIY